MYLAAKRRSGCSFALMALAVFSAAAQTPAADNPAWKVYMAARKAVGAGPSAKPLQDYTFELRTTLNLPSGKAEFASKGYFLHPGLVRQEIDSAGGKVVMVFDGVKGWQALPNDIRYLPSQAVEQYRAELARHHVLLNAPPKPEAVSFLRQDEVNGRKVDVIELRDVGGGPLQLFVDRETHDVIKQAFMGDTPTGKAQVEEFYSDFKEVGGYRWSHHKRVLRDGKLALESATIRMGVNVGLKKSDIIR